MFLILLAQVLHAENEAESTVPPLHVSCVHQPPPPTRTHPAHVLAPSPGLHLSAVKLCHFPVWLWPPQHSLLKGRCRFSPLISGSVILGPIGRSREANGLCLCFTCEQVLISVVPTYRQETEDWVSVLSSVCGEAERGGCCPQVTRYCT